MSFSSDVKEEILNTFSINNNETLLELEKFGEHLTTVKHKKDLSKDFEGYFNIASLSENSIKAILKGVFISSGCIVNPQNDYHFEIVFKSSVCSDYIFDILSLLEFTPRKLKRANQSYVIYIKEAEQISLLLSLFGASNNMMKFENIRVEKNVKNTINRQTNCETANLTKTINSSIKQIEAIEKIERAGMFSNLKDTLKETAIIRKKYPTESLDFLVKKMNENTKISKSGLKHRLDKLIEIANEIK